MNNSHNASKVFKFYLRQAWQFPGHVIAVAVTIPITQFVNNFIPPLILAAVLNKLTHGHLTKADLWPQFGGLLIVFSIVAIFGTFLWRIVDHYAWSLEAKVERSMAQKVFRQLGEQSADFHANSFVGSLVSQTTKLLSAYVRISDTTMFMVLPLFWSIVFTVVIMAPRSPIYSVVLLVFSVIYIICAFYVTRPTRRLGAEHAAAESAQTGRLADSLTNIMAIKSFARESDELRSYARHTNKTYRSLLTLMHASQRQMAFFGVTTGILEAIALLVAVIAVIVLGANIATAFLIFNYTSAITNQLFMFSNNSLRNYNRAIGDANDMIDILALTPKVLDPVEPQKSRLTNGHIRFDNVTFTHAGADDALFDGLSIDIKDGEKVGLVGHSGSGKTTFTRLLLRFSDIDGGAITINGQDIADVTQSDLHRAITYVPQEPLLFHRSIRENINYGKPDATEKEIQRAAKNAHAIEFIDLLPDGYGTMVGERGVKLSGGQRQRVAIARAMLKDSPILVLDEATSALDSESEGLIQDALWRLMQDKTAIVIAHRLSTIQHMDRIVVMDDGKIIEEGSHKALLRKKGVYASLWARQSGGFIDD